jgi:hypothetical protein
MFLRDISTIGLSLRPVREVFVSDSTRSPDECRANKKSYDGCREQRGSFVVKVEGKRSSDQLPTDLQRI